MRCYVSPVRELIAQRATRSWTVGIAAGLLSLAGARSAEAQSLGGTPEEVAGGQQPTEQTAPAAGGAAQTRLPDGSYAPCTHKADEAATAAARGAFAAGNAAFNEADYERAILYWEDAYRRDCSAHAMLKNLARAYELDGQYEEAILALETYKKRNPSEAEEAAIARRIHHLQAKLDKERQLKAAAEDKQPEAVEPLAEQDPAAQADQPEQPGTELYRSPVPLFVALAGAAVGVGGGTMWLSASAEERDASNACPGRVDCDPAIAQAGNDARSSMLVWGLVGAAGGAVAVGGLIWYFAQPTEEIAHWLPSIGPHHAGITYQGQF